MNGSLKAAVITAMAIVSFLFSHPAAQAVTIVNWYPAVKTTHTMGANVTVPPPNGWYSQNLADNGPGNDQFRFYRRSDSNVGFKFTRQEGDTNAYVVTLNVSGYFEKGGDTVNNSLVLWAGSDAFGINDTQSATYFEGDSASLTTLATQTADGPFTWSNVTFTIPAGTQNSYILVGYAGEKVGGMGNHLYSLNVAFTAKSSIIHFPSQNDNLQACVDYIASIGGGTVWIDRGLHLINQTVTLKSNVRLEGDADLSSTLKQAFVTNNSLLVTEPGTDNVTLKRVAFVMDAPIPWPNYASFFAPNSSSNITVTECAFDSAKPVGQYIGHFAQVNPTLCNGVIITHNNFKNAIDGTGMNCGSNGYIGYNTIANIADTAIGLWTGATDCTIEYNTIFCYDKTAVCIDVDGGNDSVIQNNTLSKAQVGVRLYDCHDGAYPVRGLVIKNNTIDVALTGPDGNPPIGIKVAHVVNSEFYPDYDLQFTATGNSIKSPAYGIALYGYGNIAADQHVQVKLEGNTFTGAGDALHLEGMNGTGRFKLESGSGNSFNQTGNVANAKTTINNVAGGAKSVFIGDIANRVANYTTATSLTTSWKAFNLGTFGKGVYGVAITITPAPPGTNKVQMSISGFYPSQYSYPSGATWMWSYHAQQASGPITVYLKKYSTTTTYKVTAIELFRLF
jgi:hypothetical protein